MAKNLVIVESPAKAKTIEKYLGKDYTVKSSFGHIRDLPKKGLNIDLENNFEPTYEVSADKKKVLAELRKEAKGAIVWLASDEDREGEAIAWHLAQALKLDPKTTKRIVFHEITKPAILAAIEKPRTVDQKLVDAQQARRILDRLVGYELSPVLWKKVRTGLSAGRVQSVAVRLIVEREREIKAFEAETTYKVTGVFEAKQQELPAELNKKLKNPEEAQKFLEDSKDAEFTVADKSTKPGTRNPSAPFTTSTLQQAAGQRLGYGVRQTMSLAQRLYENGHITYMRTDSTNLSGLALDTAKQFITTEYGAQYHQLRQYKTKDANAQEAHEAIRPTDFSKLSAGNDPQEQKIYELIWRRALASQMTPAKVDKTEITITHSKRPEIFTAKGEVLVFDGYFKVYGGGKDDVILPEVETGQKLPAQSITATQTYSRPPARYSEPALVKKLEELGIGRPSTYAPTISTIQTRGYIEKSDLEGTEREVKELKLEKGSIATTVKTEVTGADRSKLIPTPIADMTTDFLVKHFADILDYDFTAKAEAGFDDIAEGKESWQKMIATFYGQFHPLIVASADVSREETSQARKLGTDPKSGKPVIARYGRYGPMLQIGEVTDEEKPKFAPMPADSTLENVTFEQAMEMFKLPRTVGTTPEGLEMKANIGRFGPYIQVGKLFVSIKDLDPRTVTEEEARAAYAEKLQKEADKYIQRFKGGIDVINGPYGPYITDGKKNAKIPKDQEPKDLTENQCIDLLVAAPAKGKGRRNFKKRALKK
jgi:DNA topoisomerase-1